MFKKIFFGLAAVFLVLFLAGCAKNNDNKKAEIAPAQDNAEIILFYSTSCSHCKIVEDYISSNGVRDKISFSEREVGSDKASAALMIQRQNECLQNKEYVGSVPFLWTKDKCYLGQDEIIQFFKEKTAGAENKVQ